MKTDNRKGIDLRLLFNSLQIQSWVLLMQTQTHDTELPITWTVITGNNGQLFTPEIIYIRLKEATAGFMKNIECFVPLIKPVLKNLIQKLNHNDSGYTYLRLYNSLDRIIM